MDFNIARSLKQQSSYRHVAPLGHIIPIHRQPVFAFNAACWEAVNTKFIVYSYRGDSAGLPIGSIG